MNIKKKDLAKRIKGKTGHSEKVVNEVMDCLFNEIADAVSALDTVLIARFGVFEPRQHTGGNTRNPHTGEELETKPFVRPWFRSARGLKNRVKAGNQNGNQ